MNITRIHVDLVDRSRLDQRQTVVSVKERANREREATFSKSNQLCIGGVTKAIIKNHETMQWFVNIGWDSY